ncbi:hypothetical protein J3458_003726 [Metarhizium acridum]|uniref:uncharacterized protein n=1 Tax=Metarhizium acridum TaxID=92637 RepID=UPI001C6B66DD|nr:hypothetical protein J3458_003726 [Metarhizium acridum]
MHPSTISASIPSEFDDEVDDDLPPSREIWAYPCKLASCPDYGKSWLLRSNFLLHLKEQEVHLASAASAAARRAIELQWRYSTNPHLPPRAAPMFRSRSDPEEHVWEYGFRDHTGKIVNRRGTQRQMEQDLAQAQRRQG